MGSRQGCLIFLAAGLVVLFGWRAWQFYEDRHRVVPAAAQLALAQVVVSPASATLASGATAQFVATALDAASNVLNVPVIWSATGGSVTTTGLYTAGSAAGNFQVVATALGIHGSAAVTVSSATATPAATEDRIDVTSDDAVTTLVTGPGTVVLFDGRRVVSGLCDNDRQLPFPYTSPDFRTSTGTCAAATPGFALRDEIVVLSVDDGMLLDSVAPAGGIWKDAPPSETRPAPLPDLRSVPLHIRVAAGPTVVSPVAETAAGVPSSLAVLDVLTDVVDADLKVARHLLNVNRAGLTLSAVVTPEWADAGRVGAIGSECNTNVKQPVNPALFTPNAINVYYVTQAKKPGASPVAGWWCGGDYTLSAVQDSLIVYISLSTRTASTLAHELGHALGLLHTGTRDDCVSYVFDSASPTPNPFKCNNLMWDHASERRTTWAMGQVFRMNFDKRSAVFRTGVQLPASGRQCQCLLTIPATASTCSEPKFRQESDQVRACPRLSVTVP